LHLPIIGRRKTGLPNDRRSALSPRGTPWDEAIPRPRCLSSNLSLGVAAGENVFTRLMLAGGL